MPQKKICLDDYIIRVKCTETRIKQTPCTKVHRFNQVVKPPTQILECEDNTPTCCKEKIVYTTKCSNCNS